MLPEAELTRIRRTRRHPRRTQPDYLVLQHIVRNLERAMADVQGALDDVLDLYCGTQPYRDMLPPHLRYVSLDIDDRYGKPDVVTDEFLPFPDDSFDLVLFTEAFHYVRDPVEGAAELMRILRPGGYLILTVPLTWEYNREAPERRYTGPHLYDIFADWHHVQVRENGGYSVAWATLTGRILRGYEEMLDARTRRILSPFTLALTVAINALATALGKGETRWQTGPFILPMGLILTARRPGV